MATLTLVPVNKPCSRATDRSIADIHLSHNIKADGIIIFRSSQLNMGSTVRNTSLNLLANNGNIVLHIEFRRVENEIVFSSHNGSCWLNIEKIPLGDRLRGNNHTVIVYDHGDNYQILFNGKTGHYFKKQLLADVSCLRYMSDQDPLFSDPVVAETYVNLAALAACIN